MSDQALRALSRVVGSEHVLSDPAVMASFGTDWTGRWSAMPLAVVRPASTAEVAEVVRTCADHRLAVVPQGGNTGLVGASIPGRPGQVVVSTRRLTECGPIDVVQRQVTVGGGTTVAQIHDLVAPAGLMYGVDLASRDSATIGGTVATNAGGVRVVRFGDTRRNVVGVQAVLADGSVVDRLEGLPKDSAGYDLSGLLVGSEGTLGVITAVRLALYDALPEERVTTLVGVPTLESAVEVLSSASPDAPLLAAEYFDDTGMRLVCGAAALPHPLGDRWPFYLLLETYTEPRLRDDADAAVDRRLWEYRERQPEAAASLGHLHALDIALPLAALDSFVMHLPDLVAPHRVYTFGHLSEGNLHVQISGPAPDDESVDALVLEVVAGMGGSISSEHGIGRAKARYLHLCRSGAERSAMLGVKCAFDPTNVLNPGVLFSPTDVAAATMSS
jgi:FAD/FMN-containing dehydrogenase